PARSPLCLHDALSIFSPHFWSPEVQVMITTWSFTSHLHRPMVKLQLHTVTPLSVQQHDTIPPTRAVHRFCIMLLAIGSSHTQVIDRKSTRLNSSHLGI